MRPDPLHAFLVAGGLPVGSGPAWADGQSFGVLRVRARSRVRALLTARRQGLRLAADLVALGPPGRPARLLARDRHVLAEAFGGRGVLRSAIAVGLRAVPGAQLGALALPGVLVVGPPGSAPGATLTRLVGEVDPRRVAVCRSAGGDLVVAGWPARGRRPIAYFKPAGTSEAAALERFGPAAERAGARVPRLLAADEDWVAVSPVAGVRLTDRLAWRPRTARATLDAVVAWAVAWHRLTLRVRPLREDDLERRLLEPARRLEAWLDPGYPEWLRARFTPLVGADVPFAAAHRDLTMGNLLSGPSLGVVDWEKATDEAPPLFDLPYAAADATAAARRYGDRPRAFAATFERGASQSAVLARAAAQAGVAPLAASFAHHAGWLYHAVNEAGRLGTDGPFVAIAACLAAAPEAVDPFLR